MSGNNLAKHCCCGEQTCVGSCDCNPQYNLVGWQANVAYQHLIDPSNTPGGSQACCFDVVNWSFDANIVPIGQVLVQRQPNPPSEPCCYRAYFDVQVSGTLRVWWNFDIQSGPPLFPNCNFDETYNFNEDVPAYLDIWCSGNQWHHQITICHFQVTCQSEENTADCEGGEPPTFGCTTNPIGLRCGGGVFYITTPLECLQLITTGDITSMGYCSLSQFNCDPPPVGDGLRQYNAGYQGNGGGFFFGIYRTEECGPQDPVEPCNPIYGANAGSLIYPSAPLPNDGFWCSTNIDPPYEELCSDWERFVGLQWGQYV